MAETQAGQPQAQAQTTEVGLLDQIVEQGFSGHDTQERARGRDLVKRFVSEAIAHADRKGQLVSKNAEAAINALILDVDERLSRQVDEILHHPDFQRLEASWRGLQYLLSRTETGQLLKIKVLNLSKQELADDLENASEFDQSMLFKKVYEEEFGMHGGAPFGALIGDYEFGPTSGDVTLLDNVSKVAAAAHAPFLTAASPAMFGFKDSKEGFTKLSEPRDLAKIFESTAYAKWKSFRQKEDARYVAITVPHILMREPYGPEGRRVEGFQYQERVSGPDHSKYLWGNAAWALGAQITQAVSLYGWPVRIRGVRGGGQVDGLPVHNFTADSGELIMKVPTETPITDRREKELADLGFVPIVHEKGTDKAVFMSVQSAQLPKQMSTPEATANARLSAQLPYLFAVSRFAHYLKTILRKEIGSTKTRGQLQDELTAWISEYVVANDEAGEEIKAKHPLRDARIEVSEVPGKPGAYRAIAYLRPHFQMDEVNVSLRLVAEVPQPKG